MNRPISQVLFCLAIYGCFAAWTANILAALWGARNAMLPIAAGQAHGSLFQERFIAIGLRTAAVLFNYHIDPAALGPSGF